MIETAEKRGVMTCGHNASQAPLAPKGFITGAEYKWSTIYKGYAADLAAGKPLPNFTAGGYEVDFVQNTPFGAGATEAAKAAATAAIADMKNKEPIYVGPLKDNKTGKVVIDKTYGNLDPLPRQDGLSARRRRRFDHLSESGHEFGSPGGERHSGRRRWGRRRPRRPPRSYGSRTRLRANSEYVVIPVFALLMAALLFALFLLAIGKSPVDFVDYVWRGGFGTAFSFQNTLQRSSPLILTALAVAIPARIGLIMIGGEGALVLGGFAAAAVAVPMVGVVPPIADIPVMVVVARLRRRHLGRDRRLSAIRARRQRDDLVAAADLYRHRDHELLRRRRDARPDQSQQAVDQADRRRLHGRQHPGHRGALGLRGRRAAVASRSTF